MNKATGKPPRASRSIRKAVPLAPFDAQLRHTISETCGYLKTSRPTVYKLIKSGLLETIKEGRRTYITGRSIVARSLPR